MSSVGKVARHTLIYGVSSVVGRVINFALTPLYANLFAPADFGLFSDLYALLAYPLVVLTFGLETAFFRFADSEQQGRALSAQQAYTNAFVAVAAFGLVAATLGLVVASSIASALGYPGRGHLVQVLVGIVLLDVLAAVPLARLRQRELALRFTTISLINVGLTVALNLFLLLGLHWGVESIFWANLFASLVRFAMSLAGNLPESWRPDLPTLRAMLSYGAYIMLAGLFGQFNEMLDKNLLPRLWPSDRIYAGEPRTGLEMNGIYAANYKLGMFLVLAGQAFRYAIEPLFLRATPIDETAHRRAMARTFHYFILAGLATVLLVSAFAPEIVSFNAWGLLGKRTLIPRAYWVGLTVVPLVLLANLALAAYISFSLWFKRTRQLRFGLLFALLGVLVTVGLNLWLIPRWGYMGCAVAHLACYGSMALFCYWTGQHYYPVPYKVSRLGVYLGVVLGALAFLHWSVPPSSVAWFWKAGVSVLVLAGIALAELAAPPFRASLPPQR